MTDSRSSSDLTGLRGKVAQLICCGKRCILDGTDGGCILNKPEHDSDLKKADDILAMLGAAQLQPIPAALTGTPSREPAGKYTIIPASDNAAQAVPEPNTVIVPRTALEWLFGAMPDHEGMWFGESIEQKKPYGWRSRFRTMCEALGYPIPSTNSQTVYAGGGDGTFDENDDPAVPSTEGKSDV